MALTITEDKNDDIVVITAAGATGTATTVASYKGQVYQYHTATGGRVGGGTDVVTITDGNGADLTAGATLLAGATTGQVPYTIGATQLKSGPLCSGQVTFSCTGLTGGTGPSRSLYMIRIR